MSCAPTPPTCGTLLQLLHLKLKPPFDPFPPASNALLPSSPPLMALHQVALVVRGQTGCADEKQGSSGASSSSQAAPSPPGGLLSGRHSTAAGAPGEDAFLEELIVRRELARNFAWHLPDCYDGWGCLPGWAQETLEAHSGDPRATLYSLEQLERGETGDRWWNAAQWQMLATGHMHNYMR